MRVTVVRAETIEGILFDTRGLPLGATGCELMTDSLTTLLARAEVRTALRELMASGASIEAQIDALARFAAPGTTSSVLEEFKELPRVTAPVILQAWQFADDANKPFQLVSVAPAAPLDFARHKRVRITVDSESDAVRVALSHVPGRHAAWYAPGS